MAIISFSRGFVFVKTTKTAGTSIEVELSRVVGSDDIVTPIKPPIEGHEPQNFEDQEGSPRFYNHMPAKEIRDKIGKEAYAMMQVFCVEREPVSKCISHFHMLRNSPLHNPDGKYCLSWDEYVAKRRFPVNVGLYSEVQEGERRLIVDRVLRYDSISSQLPKLMKRFGIHDFELTERAKSKYSKNVLIRPDEVTADQRARIYVAFEETIKLTKIDWDRPAG